MAKECLGEFGLWDKIVEVREGNVVDAIFFRGRQGNKIFLYLVTTDRAMTGGYAFAQKNSSGYFLFRFKKSLYRIQYSESDGTIKVWRE